MKTSIYSEEPYMSKTIKEISEILGVSKPTVSKAVSELNLQLSKIGNRFVLDDSDAELVKMKILKRTETKNSEEIEKTQEKTKSETEETKKSEKESKETQMLIGMLQKELELKNAQIESLQSQNKEMVTALQKSQDNIKALTESLSSVQNLLSQAQTLHAVTLVDKSEHKETETNSEVEDSVLTSSADADEPTEQDEHQPESEEKVDKRPFWKRFFRLK